MDTLKLATLLAISVAADSYLEAFTHSQSGGALPPPGVVYSEPTPQPQPQFNNYLPPPQPWSLANNLKIDPGSIIPIGLSVATIFKLVLKVLIFKMIVKFMAVMCLLLVIPALQKSQEQTTTTLKPTEVPPEEGRELMIKAATTKPRFCEEDDWPCYFWETVTNTFSSSKKLTRKRRQVSVKLSRKGINKTTKRI